MTQLVGFTAQIRTLWLRSSVFTVRGLPGSLMLLCTLTERNIPDKVGEAFVKPFTGENRPVKSTVTFTTRNLEKDTKYNKEAEKQKRYGKFRKKDLEL